MDFCTRFTKQRIYRFLDKTSLSEEVYLEDFPGSYCQLMSGEVEQHIDRIAIVLLNFKWENIKKLDICAIIFDCHLKINPSLSSKLSLILIL